MNLIQLSVLVGILATFIRTDSEAANSRRVLLSNVTALTFYRGKYTTARRGRAIPQLKCISGSACKEADVPAIQCRNAGDAGGGDVQWACNAQLPNHLRLGKVNVSCEGYESPDDEFVLKGSCGLEYVIERIPGASRRKVHHEDNEDDEDDEDRPAHRKGNRLAMFIYGIIVVWILYTIFVKRTHGNGNTSQSSRYTGGSGGGSGGSSGDSSGNGSWGTSTSSHRGRSAQETSCPSGSQTYTEESYAPRQHTTSNQPGFWSGLLGGAALTYFLNNHGTSTATRTSRVTSTGGWSPVRSSRPSSSSSSSSTHSSTGFGGTSRR